MIFGRKFMRAEELVEELINVIKPALAIVVLGALFKYGLDHRYYYFAENLVSKPPIGKKASLIGSSLHPLVCTPATGLIQARSS